MYYSPLSWSMTKPPNWSESSLSVWRRFGSLVIRTAHSNESLLGAHYFYWFCHASFTLSFNIALVSSRSFCNWCLCLGRSKCRVGDTDLDLTVNDFRSSSLCSFIGLRPMDLNSLEGLEGVEWVLSCRLSRATSNSIVWLIASSCSSSIFLWKIYKMIIIWFVFYGPSTLFNSFCVKLMK